MEFHKCAGEERLKFKICIDFQNLNQRLRVPNDLFNVMKKLSTFEKLVFS